MTTNALVPVNSATIGERLVNTVNARDLYEFLEVPTHFRDWISRRIEEYGFVEGEDFRSFLSESTGGRPSSDYLITLDMAKELAMVERNDKGRQVRQYFIDCEQKWRTVETKVHALLRGALRDLDRCRDTFTQQGLLNQVQFLFGALGIPMPDRALLGKPVGPAGKEV